MREITTRCLSTVYLRVGIASPRILWVEMRPSHLTTHTQILILLTKICLRAKILWQLSWIKTLATMVSLNQTLWKSLSGRQLIDQTRMEVSLSKAVTATFTARTMITCMTLEISEFRLQQVDRMTRCCRRWGRPSLDYPAYRSRWTIITQLNWWPHHRSKSSRKRRASARMSHLILKKSPLAQHLS